MSDQSTMAQYSQLGPVQDLDSDASPNSSIKHSPTGWYDLSVASGYNVGKSGPALDVTELGVHKANQQYVDQHTLVSPSLKLDQS
jgi:hypothetical protein